MTSSLDSLIHFTGAPIASLQNISALVGFFLLASIGYFASHLIYDIWFHPLSRIPGPWWAAATRLPYCGMILRGTFNKNVRQLHEKYGEVVRVAPNELSFISGETAWQDIYGFRTGKNKTGAYLKDRQWYPPPVNGTYSVLVSDEADHSRERRLLAHAFSDKALREQEPLLQSYVDLLMSRLHEEITGPAKGIVDAVKWYNYTTFDVIADLSFGKSFCCLADRDYHPFVKMVFDSVKSGALLMTMRYFPLLTTIIKRVGWQVVPQDTLKKRLEFFKFAQDGVTARIEGEADRPDFMSHIIKHNDAKRGMTRSEIDATMVLILIAGSETTATMLSGTTYCLLKNPHYLQRLTDEVRNKFSTVEEITVEEVNKMPFLIAVLNEGLRMYPPVPTGFPRVVPAGGDTISGHYVPEKTAVYVSQFASYHSERNFVEPDHFRPERWLGDSKYDADVKQVFQPFSFGPRNCLGKNLAYAEMRLIMAKMVFHFDMALAKETEMIGNWFDQKVFSLWDKPPLMIQLTPAAKA